MKNLKVKTATIARIGALIVVLINQCLALFGKGVLPFTENMAYQVISLIMTIVVAGINCWYNQDISALARIMGKLFDALKDKKLTEEEIDEIIKEAEKDGEDGEDKENTFIVNLINGLLVKIKNKTNDKNNG